MAGGQEGGAWIRQEVRGTERIQRIQFWHGSRSQGSWPTATNPRGTWATSQRETARDQHIRAARFTTMKMGAAGSAIVLFSPVNNAVDRIIAFRFSIRLLPLPPPLCPPSSSLFSSLYLHRGIDSHYIGQQLRHRDGESSRSISTSMYTGTITLISVIGWY